MVFYALAQGDISDYQYSELDKLSPLLDDEVTHTMSYEEYRDR